MVRVMRTPASREKISMIKKTKPTMARIVRGRRDSPAFSNCRVVNKRSLRIDGRVLMEASTRWRVLPDCQSTTGIKAQVRMFTSKRLVGAGKGTWLVTITDGVGALAVAG